MGRLEKAGHQVSCIKAGMNADEIYNKFDSDIIVMPRPCEMQSLKTIKVLKDAGKKVVLDYDDNMFKVSPLSIHYKEFGTEEVRAQINDSWMDIWKNGKNIDTEKNKETLEIVKACVAAADMVTVTQPALADAYKPYNANVHCLPNCVDLDVWQKLPLKRRDDIRLYWSGGASHYEDWLILQDVLPVIFNKYPQAKLVIMGTVFHGTIKGLDKSRIEIHPWAHTQAYPYKTAIIDADISLIPLQLTDFNVCKSNIKWVEQAALEIPSVTSAVTPYIEHSNGINGVFVENTDEAWIDGISMLIDDSIMRAKVGAEARATVEKHFSIDKQYIQWSDAYESLTNG